MVYSIGMSVFSSKERVAVIRGGEQATHRVSLEHGAVILDALSATTRFDPLDVVITPSGEWLHDGFVISPAKLFAQIDTLYNAAIGATGEDGSLARACERFGVRQQASPSHAAHQTWQKNLAGDRLRQAGFQTPPRVLVGANSQVDVETLAVKLTEAFGHHLVIKPAASTQRSAVHRADSVTAVADTVRAILADYPSCLIEAYIPGQPVTMTTVPGLRDAALYHSPVMTWTEDFFTTDGNLTPETLIPAALDRSLKADVYATADELYQMLDLRGAVRTDLVVTPSGEIYFLEVNSLSPLTENAAMTQCLATVGVGIDELVDQQLRNLR